MLNEFKDIKLSSKEVLTTMDECVALSKKLASSMEAGAQAIRIVKQMEAALTGTPPVMYKESLMFQEGYQAAMQRMRMAIMDVAVTDDAEKKPIR